MYDYDDLDDYEWIQDFYEDANYPEEVEGDNGK